MDPRQQLNDFLLAELEAFAAEFVRDRTTALRRRRAEATGELVRSLEYEARAQSLAAGAQLLIAFEEQGRFIDMRRLQPPEGGADYIANLIKWIEAKGLSQKFIQGYMDKRGLKTVPDRVLTFIAFGIARKRFNGRYRRTRWYNKAKTARVEVLFDRIRAGIPELVVEELKKPFSQADSGTRLTRTTVRRRGRTTRISYARAKGRE